MAFDAELVIDRICNLIHHYKAKYLPPPMWPLSDSDSMPLQLPYTLNDALIATRNGLNVTGNIFKYACSQAKVHYFHSELQKIDDILKSLHTLNNPAACDNWISLMIQLGEDAHMSEERNLFRELLHAIRCIILENVQADQQTAAQLKIKSDFLLTLLRKVEHTINEYYDNGIVSPEMIEPLEKEMHRHMRKLAWIGLHASIRGISLIHAVFPDKSYRYFSKENATKRALPHSIFPIVLANEEMSFYCYYAKKLDLPPNHNHKMTFHMTKDQWECLVVSKGSAPPDYECHLGIQDGLNFFSSDDEVKEDSPKSKRTFSFQ